MHKIALIISYQQDWAIKVLLSVAIFSVLLVLAVLNYDVALTKVRNAEALTFIPILKQELVSIYAETGVWPKKEDIDYLLSAYNDENSAENKLDFETKNGSFIISFDTKDASQGVRTIAFHRAEVTESQSSPVFWTCGESTASNSINYHETFEGNLDWQYMPSICKVK